MNSTVFSCCRKSTSDCLSLTKDGREFHARAAATGNAWSPRVRRRGAGTISVDVSAERTRLQELRLVVRCKVSARYRGAVSWRHYPRTVFPAVNSASSSHCSTCCQLNCRYVETAIAFLIHLLQILETINNWKWWAFVSKCRRSVHSQLPFVVIHVSLFNNMLPIKDIFTGAMPPMAEWPIIMNGNISHIVILHRKHSIHHRRHHQYF